jgi:hypothetical protein
MKTQRFTIILTVINMLILTSILFQANSAIAPEASPILRGRGLELVDDQGRVRAEIKVLPPDPNVKMPDGTRGIPETVQLRLIDSEGGPNVKLVATEDGSGLVLGGESAYVQILARGTDPFVKIVNKDGKVEMIKPE